MSDAPMFVFTMEEAWDYFAANQLSAKPLSMDLTRESRSVIERLIAAATGKAIEHVRTVRRIVNPRLIEREQFMWDSLAWGNWDVCPGDLVAAEGESLVVVFEEPDLPAFVLSDKSVRVEQFTDADVYVAPTPSFAWVFAQTHESAFGPYFASAPPAD